MTDYFYFPLEKRISFLHLLRVKLLGKKMVAREESVKITGYKYKGVYYLTDMKKVGL